jgi:hypothetical protein
MVASAHAPVISAAACRTTSETGAVCRGGLVGIRQPDRPVTGAQRAARAAGRAGLALLREQAGEEPGDVA